MLVATARNTKGKPKPAMWEGILPVSGTAAPEATPGGWRTVVADGSTTLEAEAFIAMNRFSVTEGGEAAFEARFAARESTLASFDGFMPSRCSGATAATQTASPTRPGACGATALRSRSGRAP